MCIAREEVLNVPSRLPERFIQRRDNRRLRGRTQCGRTPAHDVLSASAMLEGIAAEVF